MKILDHSNEETSALINGAEYPFVFSKSYSRFVKESAGKFVLIIDEKNVVIPLKLSSYTFLRVIQILFPPLLNGKRLSAPDEEHYLNKLVVWLKDQGMADRIIQPPPYCIFRSFPTGAQNTEFGTYFINLENASEAELFQKIHPKHRNVIQNVMNKGGEIRSGKDELPVFYELYVRTMKRSNMYCESYTYFRSLYDQLSEDIVCSVVYFHGQAQGALLMPYTKEGAYYLYGASAEKMELTGAMNYLHWETIQEMKKRGVKRYDFVGARLSDVRGTKLEGIQKFKSRFGGELQVGYLWKMDLSIFRSRLFDLLLKVKTTVNRSPFPMDIIDQENEKNRFATK